MDKHQVEEIDLEYQLHYYFIDDTHTIDALTRNKIERDFLETLKKIAVLINCDLKIESKPIEDGGWIEAFVFSGMFLTFFKPSINQILTYHFTKNNQKSNLEHLISEATLKGLTLDNERKEAELKMFNLLHNKDINKSISNYYRKVNNYSKITEIEFQGMSSNDSKISTEREHFNSYILNDKKMSNDDENAQIEIISPVLSNGTYKWKGIYKNEPIEFSMGDTKFKENVSNKKYQFTNGSFIDCILHINSKYDEDGENIGNTYSVKSVLAFNEANGDSHITDKGRKKIKKDFSDKQKGLFD